MCSPVTVMVPAKLMFPLLLLLPLTLSSAVSVSKLRAPQLPDDPSWSPLTVAQCRATCLREFSANMTKNSSCMQDPDCFMCWQNCELLHSNWSVWGAMCSKKTICSPGCRKACLFLLSLPSSSSPPLSATRSMAQLLVSGSQLRWPPLPDKPHLVYVLMWSGDDGTTNSWRQLQQTAECGAQLPTSPGAVRVMVVDPGGLLAVYTPVASPLSIVASGADSANSQRSQPSEQADWFADDVDAGTGWSVRVGSVLHQGLLVVAELSWRPPASDLQEVGKQADGSALYLVTWQVDGGGVSGNLYTDDTSVTLSLWPDTVFHIQVELVWRSATISRSSPLLVDTSRLRHPSPNSQRVRAIWASMMVSWVVVTGEIATILFVAAGCCRSCWQRRERSQQKTDKAPLVGEEEATHRELVIQPDWTQSQESLCSS